MSQISEEKKREAIRIGLTTPIWRFAREIAKHKEKFRHGAGTLEGLSDDSTAKMTILGLTGIFLLVAVAISLTIFLWALVVLIKYGGTMPTWALVVSIICLILVPGPGSIAALIIVYVTKGTKKSGFKFF